MPEEIAIALVVIIGVIWLVVKIFQALGNALSEAQKRSSAARAQNQRSRYLAKKAELSLHVRVLLPKQLYVAEQSLNSTEAQFKHSQVKTNWDVHRPNWTRSDFKPYSLPNKSENCEEMNIEDIQS